LATATVGHDATLRATAQDDQRRACFVAGSDDVIGSIAIEEQLRVIQARQRPVTKRDARLDDRTRARQRPQFQPQIRIVGDLRARGTRGVNGSEHAVAGGSGDRLADARGVQDACSADQLERQISRSHPARRRPCAQIAELVPAGTVTDEIDAGRCIRVDPDPVRLDPFALPQLEQLSAEGIIPHVRDIRDARTESRCGDRHVGRVAPEPEQIAIAIAAHLVELHHRLAERDYVMPRTAHGRAGSASNAAAYSPATLRTVAEEAPGWYRFDPVPKPLAPTAQ